MPIRSQAQARYLAIHRPDLLHKWQLEAPRDLSSLPDHVKAKSKAPTRSAGAGSPARRPAGMQRKMGK